MVDGDVSYTLDFIAEENNFFLRHKYIYRNLF